MNEKEGIIILPIRKEFCDSIFSGRKRYEYRKNRFKYPVSKILVYESRGIGMIVGELTVDHIIEDTPLEVWELTQEESGTDRSSFLEYFRDRTMATAIHIQESRRYETPMPLTVYGISRPPQNFVWVSRPDK